MSNLVIQQFDKKQLKKDLPEIKPGYTVKVHQKIKEGEKERVQVYEGLVIAISHGHGPNKTITVRKMVEGIGVEKIFPLHSPNIVKIEVVRIGKVRRAKLFYMRNVSGKAARLKEVLVSGKLAAAQADGASADTMGQETEVAAEELSAGEATAEATSEDSAAENTSETAAETTEAAGKNTDAAAEKSRANEEK